MSSTEPITTTVVKSVTSSLEKAKKQQEKLAQKAKATYLSIVKDPNFKTLTIATSGGAITLGAAGGAFGTACGVVVGSAAGLIPALFTFGLSIPAGAVVGGAGGLCIGSSSGALVGGAAGFGGYKYRVEIRNGVIVVKRKALDAVDKTKKTTKETVAFASNKLAQYSADGRQQVTFYVNETKALATSTAERTKAITLKKCEQAKAITLKKCEQAVALAKNPKVQVTTASAATGGVAGGVTGGTVGLVAGAAMGVVPALFTFGLSIPIGATIGLATGAATGSTVGAVGCGTAGYVGYTHRKEIGEGVQGAVAKTSNSVDYVKTKALSSAGQVRQSVRALVASGTGGTA